MSEGTPLLRVSDVTRKFGGLVAVGNVSMELYKNEIVGIIGPNGAGKTTLFNILTGIYEPSEGRVELDGRDITGMSPHEIAKLGMTRNFQNIRLFSSMTVIENVMTGIYCRKKSGILDAIFRTPRHRREERETEEEALRYLEIVGLADNRYDMATSLPYGLQRKLEIGRALASGPKVLLLDEPAAGMNNRETEELAEFIRHIRDIGNSILLIEHDMHLVMNVCSRLYVLNFGSMIAHGTPDEIRANPDVVAAYLGGDDE